MVRAHSGVFKKKLEVRCRILETEKTDNFFMKKALHQAKRAGLQGEVPIGAVIVKDGKVIARGFNRKEMKMTATEHAEISVIKKACRKMNNWRLADCTMYVTLEPCMMCTGAIIESRLDRLVYGAENIRMGYIRYLQENSPENLRFIEIISGVLSEESSNLIRNFFIKRRME